MTSNPFKKLIKKSKTALRGDKSNSRSIETKLKGPMNRKVGTNSTESHASTASMLEAIQARKLELEDCAWNAMELSFDGSHEKEEKERR